MRSLTLLVFCALALMAIPAHEANAALLGSSCSNEPLGKTIMDTDNKNIIACVCNTVANCAPSGQYWKAMSTTKDITCASGKVIQQIQGGAPTCVAAPVNISCPTGQVITAISANGTPTCSPMTTAGSYSCPAGQTMTAVVNGTMNCTTPSLGGNYSCPAGQTMTKVVSGVTNCATPTAGGNYSCPAGQTMTQVVNGVMNCATPSSGSNYSCPAGQVMTKVTSGVTDCRAETFSCPSGYYMTGVINGTPQCTVIPPVVPATPRACAANTLFTGSCGALLVTIDGVVRPAQNLPTYSYSVPATPGNAVSIRLNTTCGSGNPMNTQTTYSGLVTCIDGQWYCSVARFQTTAYYDGTSYASGGAYVVGPCPIVVPKWVCDADGNCSYQ